MQQCKWITSSQWLAFFVIVVFFSPSPAHRGRFTAELHLDFNALARLLFLSVFYSFTLKLYNLLSRKDKMIEKEQPLILEMKVISASRLNCQDSPWELPPTPTPPSGLFCWGNFLSDKAKNSQTVRDIHAVSPAPVSDQEKTPSWDKVGEAAEAADQIKKIR